jgi:hypothetical protein
MYTLVSKLEGQLVLGSVRAQRRSVFKTYKSDPGKTYPDFRSSVETFTNNEFPGPANESGSLGKRWNRWSIGASTRILNSQSLATTRLIKPYCRC